MNKLHEIVIPTEPLPVWFHIFYGKSEAQYIAPHWHRGIELSYVLQGKIDSFWINKKQYFSKPGKILVVNTQEIHSIRNRAQADSLALSIIFPYEYVVRLYPQIDQKIIAINDYAQFDAKQKLAYLKLQSLLTEFTHLSFVDSKLKFLQQQRLIDEILCELLANFTKKKPDEHILGQRKVYVINRLQYITQYVNNHYQEDLNLQDIAVKCNISKEYLARFFKKEMEITVDTYINNVRAQHAHQELLGKKVSLTDLAINNGFSSIRSMNRAFEKLYGQSASQIKKNHIKEVN